MGQVFLGRSRAGRLVAVKLIRPEYARQPAFRERFAREVTAARMVGGFHAVQVVDADPRAERPWMVTAYIPAPSPQDRVDRVPASAEQRQSARAPLRLLVGPVTVPDLDDELARAPRPHGQAPAIPSAASAGGRRTPARQAPARSAPSPATHSSWRHGNS